MRRTENPDIRDRYPGSPHKRPVARVVQGSPLQKECSQVQILYRPPFISCGAMAARLILVQKIVVRVHAGKPNADNIKF